MSIAIPAQVVLPEECLYEVIREGVTSLCGGLRSRGPGAQIAFSVTILRSTSGLLGGAAGKERVEDSFLRIEGGSVKNAGKPASVKTGLRSIYSGWRSANDDARLGGEIQGQRKAK